MEQRIVIEASIDELKDMISQLLDEKLKSKFDNTKISARTIMKDLRVFKNTCKRNNVPMYGLGRGLSINQSDMDRLIKQVG